MTHNYIFKGKIYPERVHFSLKGLPEVELSHSDFSIKGKFTIEIVDCLIEVHFSTSEAITENSGININTLKNIIEDSTRSFVDMYCFLHSYSYDLDFETVTCEELKLNHVFSIQGEYNIQDDNNKNYIKLLNVNLSGMYPFLYYVFADFRRAIKYPGMTASFCYRAIETLRQSHFGIYNSNKGTQNYKKEIEKQSWENLNRGLGFTESDHSDLIEWAKRNRHGDYPAITYSQREKFMNHTREIINRFIDLATK